MQKDYEKKLDELKKIYCEQIEKQKKMFGSPHND